MASAETVRAERGANGGDEFGGVGLVYDGVETGTARVGFQSRRSKDRIKNHGNAGKDGANFTSGADTVAKRHKHIKNYQVRPELRGFFDGSFSIGDLAANFPVVASLSKQFGNGPAQEVMVVRNQNPNCHSGFHNPMLTEPSARIGWAVPHRLCRIVYRCRGAVYRVYTVSRKYRPFVGQFASRPDLQKRFLLLLWVRSKEMA